MTRRSTTVTAGGVDDLIINDRNLSRLEKRKSRPAASSSSSTNGSLAVAVASAHHSTPPPPPVVSTTPAAARSVIGGLLWDHLAVVEADADIVRNASVYHSVLAHHLQDALDDIAVYIRSRK
jgi:hypothetical protein